MKILFPVVRATNVSLELAPLVKNMVKAFRAELHVLYVELSTDGSFRIRLKESEKWLESFVAEHLSGLTVNKWQVVPGDPAEEILRYVDENGIDCVFIGTHGARGLSAIILGSVAKTIVGKSPVPVLCVNPYLMTNAFKKRNTEYLKKILIDEPPK
jgi:nucleotide-binding universal stress UspA family protein